MPLSSDDLSTFLPLFEAIQFEFETLEAKRAPSGIGRIKGSLRTYYATLKILEDQLRKRDPKKTDEGDVSWIVTGLVTALDDKWVQDEFKGVTLTAPDQSLLDRLSLAHPGEPMGFDQGIDLLVAGLRAILAA